METWNRGLQVPLRTRRCCTTSNGLITPLKSELWNCGGGAHFHLRTPPPAPWFTQSFYLLIIAARHIYGSCARRTPTSRPRRSPWRRPFPVQSSRCTTSRSRRCGRSLSPFFSLPNAHVSSSHIHIVHLTTHWPFVSRGALSRVSKAWSGKRE